MKVLTDVFDEMTSFPWLEAAYRKARKRKRYRSEVLEFSNNLDANLLEIQTELRNGTFVFGPYRRHWVFVPKKRRVMALPFPSRVVQWAIYLVLNPFYDPMFIEDSYACREGKGSLAAARRLQYWLKQAEGRPGDWTVIKIDISKYFYRVDHTVLMDILAQRIRDGQLLSLLENIIRCHGERFGLPRFTEPDSLDESEWLSDIGMPIGNLTSQLFANIYLNELDQFCKHTLRIRMYARYMDDIVAIAPDRRTAGTWRAEIQTFLRNRLHLDLNRKTTVCPVSRVEFVGYIVTPRALYLRKKTARRLKAAFHGICRKYFTGRMTDAEFLRRVASYDGMLSHVSGERLRARLNEIFSCERGKALTELQIIERLCNVCSSMAEIITEQQKLLSQFGTIAFQDAIADVKEQYTCIVDPGQWPGDSEGS